MFIHIGTIDVPFTIDSGDFFCPECREQTDYSQKKKKRFLAIYFIPVIPLQDVDEYVVCRKCRKRFDANTPILMADANAAEERKLENVNQHILKMMALTAFADSPRPEELATIRELHHRRSGVWLSDEEIEALVTKPYLSYQSVCDYARFHQDELEVEDKQAAARCVFLVAASTGELTAAKERELADLPAAMEISEEMFRNVVEEASLERS